MAYIDGFVIKIKKNKLQEYRKMAQKAGKIWKKYGALQYIEAIGDDMNPNMGEYKILTFPKLTKSTSQDKVIFSFIVYRSKEHRNTVNKKVMKDPFMNDPKWKDKPMPFEMKNMAYGGFRAIVE